MYCNHTVVQRISRDILEELLNLANSTSELSRAHSVQQPNTPLCPGVLEIEFMFLGAFLCLIMGGIIAQGIRKCYESRQGTGSLQPMCGIDIENPIMKRKEQ